MKNKLLIPALVLFGLVTVATGATVAVGLDRAMAFVGMQSGGAEGDPPDVDHAGVDANDDGTADEGSAATAQKVGFPLLPFPEMIVNVTDTTAAGRQTSRFLKLNLLLAYDDEADGAEQLITRQLYIRDAFQSFLRSLNVGDLQGARGIAMLKAELLRRARAVGNTDAPRDILVSDLVIQ